MTPVVRLTGVSKGYSTAEGPTRVLSDVGLTIEAGEKVSLIGPSGSGKSTLLSLIAGLLRPDDGTVEIDGLSMDDLDDAARARLRADRIGIALQSDNLIPFLSAVENVEMALAFGSRRPARQRRAVALGLLDGFGLADRAAHRPRQLSGGEAQRVALAVSMANRPSLLLADEVVASLDARTAAGVVDSILTAPCAVLFVTHEVALADLAERRLSLADGGVRLR